MFDQFSIAVKYVKGDRAIWVELLQHFGDLFQCAFPLVFVIRNILPIEDEQRNKNK